MMKRLMKILEKWFGKRSATTLEKVSVETTGKTEVKTKKPSLLDTLEAYLFTHYDFRFNVLT